MVRTRVWLASAMWLPVLAANVIAVALGIGLPLLDKSLGDRPSLPIPLSVVEQIMGALAAGMITFTGIVFSAVFVAAQIQTSSYSPRLAARLRRDRVIIAGLALPTATATYSLFALAAVGRQTDRLGEDVAPALTVGVALLLALITIGTFVALVQRAFDSTQIGGILRGLMRRAHHVIEDVHPEGERGRARDHRDRGAGRRGALRRTAGRARLGRPRRAVAPRASDGCLRRGRAPHRPVPGARRGHAQAVRRRA